MDIAAALTIQLFLAIVLGASAYKKVTDMESFKASVETYAEFPQGVAGVLIPLVPLSEFTVAVALLAPATSIYAAVVAAVLFAGYGLLIAKAVLTGRTAADCGCSFSGKTIPLRGALLWRNLGLVIAALVLAFAPAQEVPSGADVALAAFGAAALLMNYLVVEALIALPQLNRGGVQ
ncbi:MauE/DoxX family redox-associated membrane protein [Kordiimonas sp.]|uniref:MauE/DoxX family redox-associated membrane protein n=1 Tax=Kordiimonas sp. TaxID=1970157 RepID=UPI003A9572C0